MQQNGDQNGPEGEKKDVRQLPKQEGQHAYAEHDEGLTDELRISHEPLSGTVLIIHRLRLTFNVGTIEGAMLGSLQRR
jgi:hypothetical protein